MVTATKKIGWGDKDESGAICYPVHSGQASILRQDARFSIACAGTGGGKTAMGPIWVMKQIHRILLDVRLGRVDPRTGRRDPNDKRDLDREPILGMVIAPTHPILERATATTLVTMFQGTDLQGTYVPSRNRYYLPIGSKDPGRECTIWMLSADNPGGLEGGQFDFVWGDEFGQAKYLAHVAIEGRTGKKQAPVLYTTTPYGMNWLYHKLYSAWKKGDQDVFFKQWASTMNPTYPKAEYDRAKRGMSAQRAAQRYDGQFVKMAGLVYPDLSTCICDPFDPPSTEGCRFVGGIDWGWQDPFAGLCGVIDEEDHLWVWFERYKRVTRISKHAYALPKGYTYYGDPSRPDYIRELRVAGHTVRPAYNKIENGIDAVSSRIYTGRLHISSRCKALIAEGEEYRYPEKDDEITGEKPVDTFNHAMDALRYLVMGADRGRLASDLQDDAEAEARLEAEINEADPDKQTNPNPDTNPEDRSENEHED